ncbi:hypothetical protein [Amycolatopsis vancoresmycina]|uniref:Transmembrane protein n=1 Tax=Amycolatopsis vancoresmycina DSM 44592 TaxID=1292037 RepID=R1I3H4_9PSEU|nr:hypothetical protein [Amycolatopsis vancoresmycina]EOD70355.1 hypothetical protein H480_01527 [Amycolatopsis vancoresmycina DSM 44592]
MNRLARLVVVAASALLGLVALLLLLVVPVKITFDAGQGLEVNCGTAFNAHPISLACPDAQSTRQTWSFGLLAFSVVGLVGGLVVPRVLSRR